MAFLHPQPVSALWGVGGKAEEQLARLGLRTIGDVAEVPLDALARAVDPPTPRGCTISPGDATRARIDTERSEKSIGHETTFEADVTDPAVIHRTLLGLSDGVAVRLRRAGVQARTVAIKLRFEDFSTISRSRTLAEPTDLASRIYEESRSLYDAASEGGRPVRLIGVRGEQLVGAVASLGLWDDDEAWRDTEYAVDAVTIEVRAGRPAARRAAAGGPASALRARRRLIPGSSLRCRRDDRTLDQVSESGERAAFRATAAAEQLSPAFPERAARGTVAALRAWQQEALDHYFSAPHRDFLVSATPGAGKTTFALRLASMLLQQRVIDRITVVAPTEHLKGQWADAAHRAGIRLDPSFSNRHARESRQFHGVVVTYAQVAVKASLHRALTESSARSSSSTRCTTAATRSAGAMRSARPSSRRRGGSR